MEDNQNTNIFSEDNIEEIKRIYDEIYKGIKEGTLSDGTPFTDEILIKMLPFKDVSDFISVTSNFLIKYKMEEKHYPVLMHRFYEMGLNNPQILDNYIKKYIENNDMVPDSYEKRGRL